MSDHFNRTVKLTSFCESDSVIAATDSWAMLSLDKMSHCEYDRYVCQMCVYANDMYV